MSPFFRTAFGAESGLDIHVGSVDQIAESCGIRLVGGLQFHVPHAFAASLEQVGCIIERCAVEEADIDMTLECIDVPERRIFYACDRATVVNQLSHIVTAFPHLLKPPLRNRPQLGRAIDQPEVDSRVSLYCSGQPKNILSTAQPAQVQRNATRSTSNHDAPRALFDFLF
jgi:hypothetical protein